MDITSKVKVLKYFPEYLSCGMYPFYKESLNDFHIRLAETVNHTLESDLPAVEDVTFNTLQYPKKDDFLASGKFLFEVGGRGKSFEQIKDEPNSFLAVDETEIGLGNRIPLWLFGFLY